MAISRRGFVASAGAVAASAALGSVLPTDRGEFAWAKAGDHLPLTWDGQREVVGSWNLMVIDRDTGEEVDLVIECDAAKGWLRRYRDGYPIGADWSEVLTEERRGRFAIVRKWKDA